MARIAVFDPFSGASGDMILAALVDAGCELREMEHAVAQLGLDGITIAAEPTRGGAIPGTRVRVESRGDQPSRDWRSIRAMLESSSLEAPVREAALAVFSTLAAAEALAHGESVDQVHFHEVGAVDAIVDIVGACVGLHHLGVEQIVSHPVATGSGWARSSHGLLPVPAPATANIMARVGMPVRSAPSNYADPGELLTPTGAAILGALANWAIPPYAPHTVAYGFGSRELPWPNALRLWIGETDDEEEDRAGDELLIETNIDDMNPQFFAPLSDRLFAAGAFDVWLTPITMKKGRPGTVVSVITPADRQDEVEHILFTESTTLGVRSSLLTRTRASRRFEVVATRWGDVRLKLRGWKGRVTAAMPEYDDCLVLSREREAPITEVWDEAKRLGDVFIGQRWPEDSPSPNPHVNESAPRR